MSCIPDSWKCWCCATSTEDPLERYATPAAGNTAIDRKTSQAVEELKRNQEEERKFDDKMLLKIREIPKTVVIRNDFIDTVDKVHALKTELAESDPGFITALNQLNLEFYNKPGVLGFILLPSLYIVGVTGHSALELGCEPKDLIGKNLGALTEFKASDVNLTLKGHEAFVKKCKLELKENANPPKQFSGHLFILDLGHYLIGYIQGNPKNEQRRNTILIGPQDTLEQLQQHLRNKNDGILPYQGQNIACLENRIYYLKSEWERPMKGPNFQRELYTIAFSKLNSKNVITIVCDKKRKIVALNRNATFFKGNPKKLDFQPYDILGKKADLFFKKIKDLSSSHQFPELKDLFTENPSKNTFGAEMQVSEGGVNRIHNIVFSVNHVENYYTRFIVKSRFENKSNEGKADIAGSQKEEALTTRPAALSIPGTPQNASHAGVKSAFAATGISPTKLTRTKSYHTRHPTSPNSMEVRDMTGSSSSDSPPLTAAGGPTPKVIAPPARTGTFSSLLLPPSPNGGYAANKSDAS